jgi:hypothetical protein
MNVKNWDILFPSSVGQDENATLIVCENAEENFIRFISFVKKRIRLMDLQMEWHLVSM